MAYWLGHVCNDRFLVALTFGAMSTVATAQQMEARLYANPPVGVNFVVVGANYLWGDVALDPSIPIRDASAKVPSASLAYARSIDVFGNSGTIAALLPYAWVSASGVVEDKPESVSRSGFGDLAVRLAANIYGAPALSMEEFRNYRQDLIVGVSVAITAPTGYYLPDKLVNIGTHRWSFKPEVGVSKALGAWTLEASTSVTFFTTNTEFIGSNERRQDPIYALQGHAIYNLSPARWVALDTTYYWGGATSVNGGEKINRLQNWRTGLTFSQSLGLQSSVKLYGATGVSARTGSNFNALGIAYEYRWGAGLP